MSLHLILRAFAAPPAALFAALVAGLFAPPAVAGPPELPAYQAELQRDHPLVGEIRAVADGRALTPAGLAERLAAAEFVLLGETHDNPDHHALQAWHVRALAAAGRRPAVAFEMLAQGQQDTLDAYLEQHPKDAAGLGPAVDWETRGWPAWSIYRPIAEAALADQLALVAADANRDTIRAVGRQGLQQLPAERRRALGLDRPLGEAQQAALIHQLEVGHCNMLPEQALGPMAQVQRLRDAAMADSLIRAADRADGAVLIAGGGHVRADRGVPWYLRERLDAPEIAVVRFVEVQPDTPDWRAYLPDSPGDGAPAFDYLWFTPAVDRKDPCEAMAEHMEGHGQQ